MEAAFARLPTYPGRKRLEDWRALAAEGAFEDLAVALMESPYDPAYDRSSRKDERPRLGALALPDLSPGSQDAAVLEIRRLAGV